jgi:hypothetical protein
LTLPRAIIIEAKDELEKVMRQTASTCKTLCLHEVDVLRTAVTIQDEYLKAKSLKRKHGDDTKVIEDSDRSAWGIWILASQRLGV